MGDERAETYLRLLAESEARRAARRSGSESTADVTERTEYVRWAGQLLVSAGVLEPEDVRNVAAELEVALLARSGMDRARSAHRMIWLSAALTDPAPAYPPQGRGTAQPMEIVPIGRTISVETERAPSDLHLMALVRSPDSAAITAAMRMYWPADGSSADLEITGAGPQHLPYDQFWAVDDRGTRYRVDLTGEGGTLAWQGAIKLNGVPPADARWLDLVADGTHRLVRVDLDRPDAQPTTATAPDPAGPPGPTGPPVLAGPAVLAGERILAEAAELILASAWQDSWPRAPTRLGQTIRVLTAAGALAADSPTPGQLAALCQRLDVTGHGITVPAAAQIPGRWAEVLPSPAGPASPAGTAGPVGPASTADPADPGPEFFVPLGPVVADADGARFALAGLTTVGGQSFLHVLATGMPPRLARRWDTGFSWWVRDEGGSWHVAVETDPQAPSSGPARQAGAVAFRLRLTPPLGTRPEQIEVEVTGRLSGTRAVVPVGGGPEMADT